MNQAYSRLLQHLLSLHTQAGGKAMTLDNTRALNTAFGNPDRAYSIVHVAGTNGKGSVVTKVSRALTAAGYRVGMYTSPHLSCFRERVQINDSLISEEAAYTILTQGFAYCETLGIAPSFFELTTCMALKYFAEQQVEIAVIETGLGGRLDATNIVQPIVTTITSIGLDHTSILGNTREAIAAEKAGIIKPAVPVIVGPHADLAIIKSTAQRNECAYHVVEGSFDDYDSENSAIASATIEVVKKYFPFSQEAIAAGLKIRPPCRLEQVTTNVILDVAHNPDGIRRLLKSLPDHIPVQIVCGFSQEKDVAPCLRLLAEKAKYLHLVAARHARALPIDLIAEAAKVAGIEPTSYAIYESISDGISKALKTNTLVVICGSFFIMKEARQALGIPQITDPFDLNEMRLPSLK